MTSDVPGPGQPDPAEPPPPPDDSPTETVAPPAGPASTQWGAQPAPPPSTPPAEPAATPWSAAPAPAQPAPPPAAASGWGGPPPAAAAVPPPAGTPPPAAAPPPGQPGGWGAPGAPGVAPGGPPNQTWSPAPASSSGNGCLKGCLIVAVILAILAVLAIGAFVLFANRLVSDLGVDPNTGQLQQCELITGAEIDALFDTDGSQVLPLGGIVDATIGNAVLDKRILGDANDCWLIVSGNRANGLTGRVAKQDGLNASGDFQTARSRAADGKYFGGDLPGLGDEAFCTGASEQSPSFGVLVREGGTLVYVSLLDATSAAQGDWQTNEDGVLVSPQTCERAARVAAEVLR